MAEWSNAPVLKTGKDASPSRVRIPVSPPLSESHGFGTLQDLNPLILPLTFTPKKIIAKVEEKYANLFYYNISLKYKSLAVKKNDTFREN